MSLQPAHLLKCFQQQQAAVLSIQALINPLYATCPTPTGSYANMLLNSGLFLHTQEVYGAILAFIHSCIFTLFFISSLISTSLEGNI